jgi:hypothetical protein
MIAEATLWAAENAPREMVIAGSALKAIVGQKLFPGLVDRYLARVGYEAQQADFPVEPERPDNLFSTVPGDPGASGEFSDEAHLVAPQLLARMHPAVVGAVGTGIAAGVVAAVVGLTRRAE